MRRWHAVLALALLAGLGWFSLRALLQPERLGALVVAKLGAASGLAISLDAPATLGLWPQLHLALPGLQMRAPGASAPLLRSESLAVYLPLRVLWSPLQVAALRIDAPRLDLVALQDWLGQRRDDGPPAPLRLPDFGELQVADGRLDAAGWRIDGLHWRLTGLAAGARLESEWRGRIELADDAEADRLSWPFALRLQASVARFDQRLELQALQLALGSATDPQAIDLQGVLQWQSPLRAELELRGTLQRWPTDWPPAPAPLADWLQQPLPLLLRHRGALDGSGEWTLELGEETRRLALRGVPAAVLAWITQADFDQPLPLHIDATVDQIDIDGVRIDGLRVVDEIDSSAGPAEPLPR